MDWPECIECRDQMSWVVRGSGNSKHREERITVPGEEEMARALSEGTARALGGELFRPLVRLSASKAELSTQCPVRAATFVAGTRCDGYLQQSGVGPQCLLVSCVAVTK